MDITLTRLAIFVALVTGVPLAAVIAQVDSAQVCTHPPAIAALALSTNDMSFDEEPNGTSASLPIPVQTKIHELARRACLYSRTDSVYSRTDSVRSPYPALEDFYGPIFLITAPSGDLLFVFTREWPTGGPGYFFILYNPASRLLTGVPPATYGKWSVGDTDVQRPLVAFEDLDHDGAPELAVREISHNGTEYNARVRHYYRIGRDLSLEPVLALEEESTLDQRPYPTTLIRRVRPIARDSLLVETLLRVPGVPDRTVGNFVLARGPVGPYHLARRHVLMRKYSWALVTTSGDDENEFLIKGYTVWY
jgi:hypothetical protein